MASIGLASQLYFRSLFDLAYRRLLRLALLDFTLGLIECDGTKEIDCMLVVYLTNTWVSSFCEKVTYRGDNMVISYCSICSCLSFGEFTNLMRRKITTLG